MASPNVNLGSVNRLLASVTFPTFGALNVPASYLSVAGIDVSLEGEATAMLPCMTAVVTSPLPYQMATVTINLVKTLSLANLFKIQHETSTLLGACNVRPDVSPGGIGVYNFTNSAIQNVLPGAFNGTSPTWTVVIQATYPINSNLYT